MTVASRAEVVLGIDPGTALLGYGIVEATDGPTVRDFGCLETTPELAMPNRLLLLYDGLREVIDRWRPDVMVVEELFFARNVTTALTVGQARGIVLLAAAQHHLPVAEYKPSQVKQAVSGYGKAGKSQMQEIVRLLLGLDEVPYPDDAADALAVALCHIQSRQFFRAVASEGGQAQR